MSCPVWQLRSMQPNVLSGSLQWELEVGLGGHQFTWEVSLPRMRGPGEAIVKDPLDLHVLLLLDVDFPKTDATSFEQALWGVFTKHTLGHTVSKAQGHGDPESLPSNAAMLRAPFPSAGPCLDKHSDQRGAR